VRPSRYQPGDGDTAIMLLARMARGEVRGEQDRNDTSSASRVLLFGHPGNGPPTRHVARVGVSGGRLGSRRAECSALSYAGGTLVLRSEGSNEVADFAHRTPACGRQMVGADAPLACLAVARRRRAKAGWEAGIRTPITWFRGRSPDVDGDGSPRFYWGFQWGPPGCLGSRTAVSYAVCQDFIKSGQSRHC
jgi:hypothetical protein